MGTWATQMAALNTALLDTFPDSIWFQGVEIDCIAPPPDVFKTINPQNYDPKVTFTFQILETARVENAIGLKSPIEFETPYAAVFDKDRLTFQVNNFEPDKNDSMVRLVCTLLQ